jgi:P-type Ca2+ transporter type 2C
VLLSSIDSRFYIHTHTHTLTNLSCSYLSEIKFSATVASTSFEYVPSVEHKVSTMMNSDVACRTNVSEIIKILQTDPKSGLNDDEVVSRRKFYGHNDFDIDDDEPMWKKYLGQFKEPMIVLLLVSALISLLMKQYDDALSITVAIVIVVTVAFIQENRAEKEIEALKRLVPPKCTCIRQGKCQQIFAKDLVPGDLCMLDIGDRIPADLRLIEANDISVDESSFTGETKPSMKIIEPLAYGSRQTSISDRKNVAFMGTHVLNGNAKVIIDQYVVVIVV